MMGIEAFKKDRDLLERWLIKAGGLPPNTARASADELFRGGRAQVGAGFEGGKLDIPDAVRYRGVNTYAGTQPSERQLITDLARQSLQEQGYQGIKYINTSSLEVPRGADPTSYIVFKPSDLRSRPAARMDAAKMDSADLLAGLAGGGLVAGGVAAAPNQAQAAPRPPFNSRYAQTTIADALASLAGRGSKDATEAAALSPPPLPAPPPMPPRPAPPPSQFAPMPVNPAMTPQWLQQHFAPHLSDPGTFQGRPQPTIATNAAGKTYPPEMTHAWQGALADVANLATNLIGVGF
jgi:hypothetical protein